MNARFLPVHIGYYFLCLIMALSLLLPACGKAPTVPAPEATDIMDTPTKLPESTHTPTATIAPTASSTPTPLPTLIPLRRISSFNATQIEQIYRMGLGTIRSAAWSPDGQMLVLASSVGLYVYDMQAFWKDKKTLTLVKFIEYPDLNVITFSPDGKLFANGSRDGSVQIWETNGMSLLNTYESMHSAQVPALVTALTFDPSGEILVSGGDDGIIDIRNITSGQSIYKRAFKQNYYSENHHPTITGIAYSNDGTLVYVGGTGDFTGIKVFTLPDGEQNRYVEIPDGLVYAFSSAQGLVAVGTGQYAEELSWVGSVVTYDFDSLGSIQKLTPGNVSLSSYKLTFSPSGRLLASSSPGLEQFPFMYTDVIISNASADEVKCSLGIQESEISWLSFSPDDTVLLVSGVSGVSLWDTEKCTHIISFDQRASVLDMTFSETGRILTANQNGSLLSWVVPSSSIDQKWELLGDLEKVSFSRNGKYLAKLTPDRVSVLTFNGDVLSSLYELIEKDIAWIDMGESNDSVLLAYASYFEPAITVVDVSSQNVVANFTHWSPGQGAIMDLSSDGTKSAIFTYHTIVVWAVPRGPSVEMIGCSAWATDLLFSPQGTFLAEACDDKPYKYVHLLNVQNGNTVWRARVGESVEITSFAFSPDEEVLASGDSDGMIYLWNVKTGNRILEWRAHYDQVNSLMFSNDGAMLVSGSKDGMIVIWGVR